MRLNPKNNILIKKMSVFKLSFTFIWLSFDIQIFSIIFRKNLIFVIHSDTFTLIFTSLLLNTQAHICDTFSFTFVWHSIRFSFSKSLNLALMSIQKEFHIRYTFSLIFDSFMSYTQATNCYRFSLTFVWHSIIHLLLYSEAL